MSILEDFVLPAQGSQSWRDGLREKIDSTLSSGGRVFVARHVFDPNSYKDLAGGTDPFSPFVDIKYKSVDGPKLFEQVRETLKRYHLAESEFAIGLDKYEVINPGPS